MSSYFKVTSFTIDILINYFFVNFIIYINGVPQFYYWSLIIMATTVQNITDEYPIPVYRFTVTLGEEDMAFSEVAGLDIANDPITYKDGLGVKYMPGQESAYNITLKRGIVKAKTQLFDWINAVSLNLIDKKDITISLTNETADAPIVTWTVSNAFPKKLTGPSLNGSSNEVSIESLEMMADGIQIAWL